MLKQITRLFTPPVFENDFEKTQDSQVAFTVSIALFVIGLVSPLFIIRLTSPIREIALYSTLGGLFLWLLCAWLVKSGRVGIAKAILITVNTINIYIVVFFTGGMSQPNIFVTFFLLALAVLLYPRGGALLYGLVNIGLGTILYFLGQSGIFQATDQPITSTQIFLLFQFVFIATPVILQISSLSRQAVILKIREREEELARKNKDLDALTTQLELKVAERTADLERTTLAVERRASQLQAVSDVARSTTTVQELSELLPQIARQISQYFGFYHVGIFLLDENGEYAELRAASSEGGQRMLARGHRLRIGYQGVVGFAARQGRARIALDTGEDAVFFNNPDLPTTRSEAALPLILGEEVIGVLDVQSEAPEAFSEEDLEVLNTLAYQVATAIQNARLYSQVRRALEDAERINRQQIRTRWSNFGASAQKLGYKFDESELTQVLQPIEVNEISEALENGTEQQSDAVLALPIKLRGETIGVIGLRAKSNRQGWSPVEMSIAKAAAERAALALENARLVEEAQRRASLERLTTEITGKIGTSVQYKSIMRIAAEELSRALGSEVMVQITSDTQDSEN